MSVVGLSQLVTRVLIREGRIGLPPELAQLAPAIDPRFAQQEACVHAVVDNDASIINREVFDLAKITGHLDFLHQEIKASFESTVFLHAAESRKSSQWTKKRLRLSAKFFDSRDLEMAG
ncbi:hypothetical protein SAMN05216466_101466 [Paraburkholderia phenazinium]|uniref:Uncharacterized protein n=1 Tax=Paraburkholderia phenazinium TaxID=60549 RepID=A0A1G7PUZ4_9BURK|nr:hypothetical protein SAMN05216466_101466 [Paraburkholderia phenazinium]